MTLRILLADDHQMFRESLRSLLEQTGTMEVVAQTGNGLEVVALARETRPAIVCMDIGMPGMNGIEVTRKLMAAMPEIKVIALSVFFDQSYVTDMMLAGASAYVTKNEASSELLRAIEAVQHQRKYFSPGVASAVAGILSGDTRSIHPGVTLGARERQVLQLVTEGNTSAQIATALNIALGTVEVHRRNIMRKLDLHSVAELTRYAIQNGLTQD